MQGSGKTHFNRIKAKGQSWLDLRFKAISEGKWAKIPERQTPNQRSTVADSGNK
jgi:hypothetical protein